jgi:hypothetical protein
MMKPPLTEVDLPVFKKVAGHYGETPFLLTSTMFGGLPFELAGCELSELIGKPVAAPHTHEFPEVYLLISPKPGGAMIEISLDETTHELVAPGAMFIPAGATHCFVTRKAIPGSYAFGVLLTSASDSTQDTKP